MNANDQKTLAECYATLMENAATIDQLKERVAFLEKQNAQLIEALAQPRTIVNSPPQWDFPWTIYSATEAQTTPKA